MLKLLRSTRQFQKSFTQLRNFSATTEGQAKQEQANGEENKQHSKEETADNEDDIWNEEDNFEEEESEQASKRRRIIKNTLFFALTGWFGANVYYAKQSGYNDEIARENVLYNSYVFGAANAVATTVRDGYQYLLYPPIKKFLPDEPPLRPELLRKTLVLNFEGTLYAKDFSVGNGVLIHLRPGFKKFVDKMSQLYDIVIYSNEDTAFMTEVIQTIDPYQRYFMWNLGREFFTTKGDGQYKDLRFLNRDPRKFIVVDFSRDNYLNNQDNVVVIDKYNGKEQDDGLKNLQLFLEHCANPKIRDIRKEIQKHGGENSVQNYRDKLQRQYDNAKSRRNMFFGYGKQKQSD